MSLLRRSFLAALAAPAFLQAALAALPAPACYEPGPGAGLSDPLPGAPPDASIGLNMPPPAVANPAPALSALSPSSAIVGGPAFQLRLTGGGFIAGSQVLWNGQARAAVFVSGGELTASIPAADTARLGPAIVSVVNPAPGGGSASMAMTLISPLAADPEFALRTHYAFPNPARGVGAVTFRVQPGLADEVEVRVYDDAGRRVHGSTDFRSRGAFDDGNGSGAQFTFDHVWDVSGVASGLYTYVVTARKAGRSDESKTGKVGVIK